MQGSCKDKEMAIVICIYLYISSTVAIDVYSQLLQIEEIPESQDGVHYYDELPCNVKKEKLKIEEIKIEEIKKDDHTGEIAYQAEEHPSVCTIHN